MPIEPSDYLGQAGRILANAELQLTSLGHHPRLVKAALARARGTAEFRTRPLSAAIRGQAFLEILTDEITHAEDWIERERDGSS